MTGGKATMKLCSSRGSISDIRTGFDTTFAFNRWFQSGIDPRYPTSTAAGHRAVPERCTVSPSYTNFVGSTDILVVDHSTCLM